VAVLVFFLSGNSPTLLIIYTAGFKVFGEVVGGGKLAL